ncbi:MAG: haloacid dehalogenase type II [Pseudomonadota bacterium]
MSLPAPKALLFDVFGTVVDWRTSIIRELTEFGKGHGISLDWEGFADQWRGLYQPSMEAVRTGAREWTTLDELHRESLDTLLSDHGVLGLSEEDLVRLNRAWHRLDPWPDTVPGLSRLRRNFILSTLSNGNTALLLNMAKRSALPFDVILGAETARAYKPVPSAYLETARMVGLAPSECMMVAAHNDDLVAATELGLQTAFVCRPTERGPNQTIDLEPNGDWTYSVSSFEELADALQN